MFESGETGQLVDQLRITGRSLVSGAGEGGVSLQSLRNLAITMGDIAIAGLQLGAALSQLLVGKLDVHRTVRNVDVDDVAVLDQSNRALVRGLRRDVSDRQTGRTSGIAAVGEHGHLLADALAFTKEVGYSISCMPGPPFGPS